MYASIDKVIDKLERQIRDAHATHKKKGADGVGSSAPGRARRRTEVPASES